MRRATLILCFLALTLRAQGDRFGALVIDMDPAPVPATLTDVFTTTTFVEEVTLSNTTTSAVTVTIQDRNSPARAFFKDLTISGNSTYVVALRGRKFPGGVAWSASTAGAVVGYVQGRR
jgi:hypothetical protein